MAVAEACDCRTEVRRARRCRAIATPGHRQTRRGPEREIVRNTPLREGLKNIAAVVFIFVFLFGLVFTGCAFADGSPKSRSEFLPIGLSLLGASLVPLAVLIWMHFQRDLAPDLLSKISRRYFNANGLCFVIVPVAADGKLLLRIHYQSRHVGASVANVIIRPSPGFFLQSAKINAWQVRFECPEAGYGVVSVPVSLPARYQGTSQKFDLWAQVQYPEGKGKTVRFGEGAEVGNAPPMPQIAGAALIVAGAVVGLHVHPRRSAHVTLRLPTGVAEHVPHNEPAVSTVLWKWGDSIPVEFSHLTRGA